MKFLNGSTSVLNKLSLGLIGFYNEVLCLKCQVNLLNL